jgi:hypothetical protein
VSELTTSGSETGTGTVTAPVVPPQLMPAAAPASALQTTQLAITAADAEATWASSTGCLSDLLVINEHGDGTAGVCTWRMVTFDHLDDDHLAAVAWHLADEIMASRFGPATAKHNAWRNAALGRSTLTESDKRWLRAFTSTVFGLPDAPKDSGHIQGHVSEWLWYLLTLERVEATRTRVHLEPPKFQVTDGGGDGFIAYSSSGTPELCFRLWEIKKHDLVKSTAKDIIRGAADQLSLEGTRYLAQLTKPLGEAAAIAPGEPRLLELAAELVDLWIEANPRAGAGVSVASSNTSIPSSPFDPMAAKLTDLVHPRQLEGLLSVVTEYARLAGLVRGFVWTPL